MVPRSLDRCTTARLLIALLLSLLLLASAEPHRRRTARAIPQVEFSFEENTGSDYSVGRITSQQGSDFRFTGGSATQCNKYFNLVANTGEVLTKLDIDREAVVQEDDSDTISCLVTYINHASTSTTVQALFHILDQNDFVPYFSGLTRPVDNRRIYENVQVGNIVAYLMPLDLDAGANGSVTFSITGGNYGDSFSLTVPSGEGGDTPNRLVTLKRSVNYEDHNQFNLTFFLSDAGQPPLNSTQYLVINILDLNDQDPAFQVDNFLFNVSESHPIGSAHPIGTIDATDPDSPTHSQIFYQLDIVNSIDAVAAEFFAINTTSGDLYLIKSLDYDSTTKHTYQFRVEARNPSRPTGTTADITVKTLDANDEPPSLEVAGAQVELVENSNSPAYFLFRFQDRDKAMSDNQLSHVSVVLDPPLDYTSNIQIVQHPFANTPALILVNVTVLQSINREQHESLHMSITVTDSGSPPLSSTLNITVPVIDINDNAPLFSNSSYEAKISSAFEPVRTLIAVAATDSDSGKNGLVTYSLTRVSPTAATRWFSINNLTGMISLVDKPSYQDSDNGIVRLTVTARDNGSLVLSNTTMVTVTLTPPVTFQPISYQHYNGIDLSTSSVVYMEFRTFDTNALLLYQNSETSFTSLQIIDGHVVYDGNIQSNDSNVTSNVRVNDNKWYSLLLNKTVATLEVWERGSLVNSRAIRLLQTARLQECNQATDSSSYPLYVGGVSNAFSIPSGRLISTDFVGTIAAISVDYTHLDSSCPAQNKNTAHGSPLSSICNTNPCGRHAYCVPYPDSRGSNCHCRIGFPIETCDEEQDYGPVTVTNNSYIQFGLGYNFFYSKNYLFNQTGVSSSQSIRFSFIPKRAPLTGMLFYSETSNGLIQRLEVDRTFRYSVTTSQTMTYKLSLISEAIEQQLSIGKEYTIELNITSGRNGGGSMTLTEKGGTPKSLHVTITTEGRSGDIFYPFAARPFTLVSLGGAANPRASFVDGHFDGCITAFAIDEMEIPLRGLMTSKAQNLTAPAGALSSCHPCNMAATCPQNSSCTRLLNMGDTYKCQCNSGYTNSSGTCIRNDQLETSNDATLVTPIPTHEPPTVDGNTSSQQNSALKFYYIIVIAGTGVVLVAVAMALLAVMFRCAYTRGKKDTRRPQLITQITYHQGNGDCCLDNGDIIKDTEGGIVPVKRKSNNYVDTKLMMKSVHSVDEVDHDSTLGSLNSPLSCRKSTSQETGFHTASEHDGLASTRSSPQRNNSECKDSGRYDSDATTTDSEDLTTSGIEEVMSPNEVTLVSSGSMMGVPTSFRRKNPLSTHEQNALTPLKPNSSLLLSTDETDTEISTSTTNVSSQQRRLYYENESLVSESNKWYKNSSPSTIVESDQEKLSSSPYGTKPMVLHKPPSRRRSKPPSLPHIKQYVPSPHSSPYSLGHHSHHYPYQQGSPMSSSPLVKSHRLAFDYPPSSVPPMVSMPPGGSRSAYYNPMEQMKNGTESRHYPPQPPHPYVPYRHQRDHTQYPPSSEAPYYPGYQGTSLTPGGGQAYCDLNSFAKVNPITYWEQQQLLRPIVDQEDPLRFLREPCRKFEDVSTTPSVAESTVIDSVGGDKDSAVASRGARPQTARGLHDYVVMPRTLPPHPLMEMPNELEEENGTLPPPANEEGEGEEDEVITHFPSADCTPTLPSSGSENFHQSVSTLGDPNQQQQQEDINPDEYNSSTMPSL